MQQSSIIKENSGYSSENIVKKMIIEDNVANATIVIDYMKEIEMNKQLVLKNIF